MSDETRCLCGCRVTRNEPTHRSGRQTEGFRGSVDEGSYRSVAMQDLADDGLTPLRLAPVLGLNGV
jgi:hypothetical protein